MDIKNSAVTAKMVIHSLLTLLENENVDISSVKFKVGSDGNGYESPEFELENLVSLAIDGLVELEDAGAVPEGFVLMPIKPTEQMIKATDTFNQGMGAADMGLCYQAMIEAQEQSHECQNP
jgi:hypothetical protein